MQEDSSSADGKLSCGTRRSSSFSIELLKRPGCSGSYFLGDLYAISYIIEKSLEFYYNHISPLPICSAAS